tara:strand:- start:566 stop:973 length:408 start_codon:yes stop_codon:yes gene_type:complete
MNEKKLIRLILQKGQIDEEVFLLSFALENSFLRNVFRILQEIDCTVYRHQNHFPMDIDFLIHQNLIEINNKNSVFTASTISELYSAKKAIMNKLKKFFQKERFDIIYDQYLELVVRIFIRDFVNEKIQYLNKKIA